MNQVTPVIEKTLICSTKHITKEDAVSLEAMAGSDPSPLIVYDMGYGYLIYTGQLVADEDKKEMVEAGLSEACINLLFWSRDNDCVYLHLDGNGAEYDNLPTYEW